MQRLDNGSLSSRMLALRGALSDRWLRPWRPLHKVFLSGSPCISARPIAARDRFSIPKCDSFAKCHGHGLSDDKGDLHGFLSMKKMR